MTTTTAPTPTTVAAAEPGRRRRPLLRATATSGAVAAVAVTALAAAAAAADVPLEVDGEAIPLLGFTQITLVGAALGGLLAAALRRWSRRAHRTFVATCVGLTALSCVPSVALPPDTATRSVLVATHLLAAAIIVPAVGRHVRR